MCSWGPPEGGNLWLVHSHRAPRRFDVVAADEARGQPIRGGGGGLGRGVPGAPYPRCAPQSSSSPLSPPGGGGVGSPQACVRRAGLQVGGSPGPLAARECARYGMRWSRGAGWGGGRGAFDAWVRLARYPMVGDGVPLVPLVTAIQSAGGQDWGRGQPVSTGAGRCGTLGRRTVGASLVLGQSKV